MATGHICKPLGSIKNKKMRTKLKIVNLIIILILITSCKKKTNNEGIPIWMNLSNQYTWKITATPNKFPEFDLDNDLRYNSNRSKISWFNIDSEIIISPTPLTRPIVRKDFFDESNSSDYIEIFNISYYPSVRGMYNFDSEKTNYSQGISENGLLNDPKSRWAGIQRDADAPYNINKFNYIDFWLLNPFSIGQNSTGKIYINYGEISEDILKDGFISDESRISENHEDLNDTSVYGIMSRYIPIYWGFPNNLEDWNKQDVGLDCLSDTHEQDFFSKELEKYNVICNDSAYDIIINDPSADNFMHYSSIISDDVIKKYYYYNGLDKNTPHPSLQKPGYSNLPDTEDLNLDLQLKKKNSYFEYEIIVQPDLMTNGNNHIVESKNINGEEWLHFSIPTTDYSNKIGLPENFEVFRIYLTDFETNIHLRFLELKLSE